MYFDSSQYCEETAKLSWLANFGQVLNKMNLNEIN